MGRAADLLDAHRPAVAVVVVLATLVAGASLTRLRFDDNLRNLFRASDRSVELLEEVYAQFGGFDGDVLLLVRAPDLFAPEPLRAMWDLAARAREVEGVESVLTPADLPAPGSADRETSLMPEPGADEATRAAAKRAAIEHPVTGGRLVSLDGTTGMVVARIARERSDIRDLREPVSDLRAMATEVSAAREVEIGITGVPVVRVDAIETLLREQGRFIGIGMGVGALVALVVFRRAVPVLIATAAAGTGALWTGAAFALAGEEINALTSVVPTIVLLVGFADAVHLLHEAKRGRAAGLGPREAAKRSLATVGPACLLASVTTAVGFGSLTLAELDAIQQFGVSAAVGALLTFVAVNTIVPLLCSTGVLGGRLGPERSLTQAWWDGLAGWGTPVLMRRARLVTGCGLVLAVALAVLTSTVRADTSLTEALPRDSEAVRWLHRADEAFGGVLRVIALVEWEGEAGVTDPEVRGVMEAVEEAFAGAGDLTRPFSVFDLLSLVPLEGPEGLRLRLLSGAAPELVEHYYRADLNRALVVSAVPDAGMARLEPTFDALEAALREIGEAHAGVRVALTGDPIAIGRNSARMVRDLARSLGFAGLVIFGVIAVALGSLRLGVVSVVPNALPILAATGLLGATGLPLNPTAVVALCVCLGIAVDDTIHYLARYRLERARRGVGPWEATRRSLAAVGGALGTTTAVLILGSGATALSEMPILWTFGVLLMAGLGAAFVADVVVLPAMVAWLDSVHPIARDGEGRRGGAGGRGPRESGGSGEGGMLER